VGHGLAIVVGDVTGHGIGPALITASAQGSLRTSFRLSADPGQVVTLLNQDLCERIEDGRFLTLFLATLGGGGEVHALNAGHSEPFLWRAADRAIQTIPMCGPALGMIADEVYRAHEPMLMHSGDVLVAYTDGLTEARKPGSEDDFFGEEGLRRALDGVAANQSAHEICARLAEAALAHAGGLREDDVTVVVARRAGWARPSRLNPKTRLIRAAATSWCAARAAIRRAPRRASWTYACAPGASSRAGPGCARVPNPCSRRVA
jgi:serine phosphatase RsbU (regulator of sigma subunit)